MSENQEAVFDSTAPTAADMDVSVKRLVDAWTGDWKPILTRVCEQTGLTLQEAMQWEMVMTWADMVRHIRANLRWSCEFSERIEQHMQEEHGGEEPWKEE